MTLRTKYILAIICIILGIVGTGIVVQRYIVERDARIAAAAKRTAIDAVLSGRIDDTSTSTDVFGDDATVRILLIGLDTRAGESVSHCDAIQLLTINKETESITITAVPRGTYSPLPPGTGTTSSDYYVSNSCALGGLEFGVHNIERILGTEADYVAFIGFSELVGALRTLRLPTTETVQWLRHRQGYAIGEPQRAHNHSTFIKQMLVRFTPKTIHSTDTAMHYILYKFIDTDLSFAQVKSLIQTLSDMRIYERPEAITLAMRPAYDVQDIAYDETTAGDYVREMVGPISRYLNPADYQELTETEITANIITLISEKSEDPEFIRWAWDHKLWFQIYDEDKRLEVQYDIMLSYLELLDRAEERQAVLGDYVLEMDFLGYDAWKTKGETLIAAELAL